MAKKYKKVGQVDLYKEEKTSTAGKVIVIAFVIFVIISLLK